ncbi:CfrBI family restriction endonuclease [Macrococcoides canis]|uniref:CfrBI family restriction endonuclease n=1 Tax=Macrococcoides canis TaxID=1855823 RepID=UPI0020B73ABC|nr:CfrBI family restriction endonuclease [Macrococcus canis]UTH06296.1 CfrBI family restriction endonuclease [Macrococcus canis]
MSKYTRVSLGKVLEDLYNGNDYRGEVISLIQDEFLSFSIDFFKKVMIAKIENKTIDIDWYKKVFIEHDRLKKEEIAINAGLNMKTISNKYRSTKKEIVIEASSNQYEELKQSIEALIELEPEIDLKLTIKYNSASVELSLNETLIVINTLAVKRAAIRGGAWSSIGKSIEKPLMKSLCLLYDVPSKNYELQYKKADYSKDNEVFSREIDFYLENRSGENLLCEVKLMGNGNPESADAVIARDTALFVADTLSETNKRQLNKLNVKWIELRSEEGYRKFNTILEELDIPYNTNSVITNEDIKSVINNNEIY